MQEINCIFCDKSTDNVVIRENGFTGKQCSCGLIYISPRPSLSEIIDVYGHDDAHSSADAQMDNELGKRLAARHHLKILKRYKQSGSLLEIGAGAGYFLDESKRSGFNPRGIELNRIQAEFIRNHHLIPCEEKPLDQYPTLAEKFDVIYHCDVISHFYDPVREFELMHEIMNDNALLMFETGNYGDMDKRYYSNIPRFQYPDHLFFFSTQNLEALLQRSGFELLEIHRFSILPYMRLRAYARRLAGLFSRNLAPKTVIHKPDNPNSKDALKRKKANGSSLKIKLKDAWAYANFIARYKLGRFFVSHDKPQTMLLVARKRTHNNN